MEPSYSSATTADSPARASRREARSVMPRSPRASATSGKSFIALLSDRTASLSFTPFRRIAFKIGANAGSELQRAIEHGGRNFRALGQKPPLRHPHRKFPRPGQFIALHMLHAVMREMPDIERIGEIIEMGQFVGNLEFSGLFGHLNTSKTDLLVDSKRHQYNTYTGV